MADKGRSSRPRPLDQDRIVRTAVDMADAHGIDGLSMRSLGRALGVEAMSLYHHVAGKEQLLDAMVDAVFAEIELPGPRSGWRTGMRKRAASARGVLLHHRWAVPLMDSRMSPGPATLRHHDAVLGCLRRGGFTVAAAAHAISLLDSFVFGFVLQELALPFDTGEEAADVAEEILEDAPAAAYPYLTELVTEHVMAPGYDHRAEFDFGLELILDGLGRLVDGP